MRWMGIVSVVALFACGHTQSTATASRPAGEQAYSDFASAYADVESGIEAKATAGKFTFVDRGEGVINVVDEDKRATEERRLDRVADRWIERDVANHLES